MRLDWTTWMILHSLIYFLVYEITKSPRGSWAAFSRALAHVLSAKDNWVKINGAVIVVTTKAAIELRRADQAHWSLSQRVIEDPAGSWTTKGTKHYKLYWTAKNGHFWAWRHRIQAELHRNSRSTIDNSRNIISSDNSFDCPIIYINIIHNVNLFIDTWTMCETTKFIF